jgi:hypothetical protein
MEHCILIMAFMDEKLSNEQIPLVGSGVTLAEFLSIIPKKTTKDHEWDKKEMRRVHQEMQLKGIELNPKTDLEQAIVNTQQLMK